MAFAASSKSNQGEGEAERTDRQRVDIDWWNEGCLYLGLHICTELPPSLPCINIPEGYQA